MTEASHGISQHSLDILRACLAPFADRIEAVGLFGSRATGRWRPASDIDLVLTGPRLTAADIARIALDLADSYLPVRADVVAAHMIHDPALAAHIARFGVPLFTSEDL
jgi:uncharacterized protein